MQLHAIVPGDRRLRRLIIRPIEVRDNRKDPRRASHHDIPAASRRRSAKPDMLNQAAVSNLANVLGGSPRFSKRAASQ
jgi:hypothetical protein